MHTKMASSNIARPRRLGGTCLACSSFPHNNRLQLTLQLTLQLPINHTRNPTRSHSCTRTQPSLGTPRIRTACLSSPRLVSEPSSCVFASAYAMLTNCKL
jgi:hypothetical protein